MAAGVLGKNQDLYKEVSTAANSKKNTGGGGGGEKERIGCSWRRSEVVSLWSEEAPESEATRREERIKEWCQARRRRRSRRRRRDVLLMLLLVVVEG